MANGCSQCIGGIQIGWQYIDAKHLFQKIGDLFFRSGTISGNGRALLTAERSALNFLQLLSAVASKVRIYADTIAGTRASRSQAVTRAYAPSNVSPSGERKYQS